MLIDAFGRRILNFQGHYDMTLPDTIKAPSRPQLVAVICSELDLNRATRLRRSPDLFELRLDGLSENLEAIRAALPRLKAPLIITARSPAEGGVHSLSASRRRNLLLNFLFCARYVDLELRSVPALTKVLDQTRKLGVRLILSHHDLRSTPSCVALHRIVAKADALGADICKIAARTDRIEEVERLIALMRDAGRTSSLALMGLGRLGRISRRRLVRAGSVLNYAHLGCAVVPGQLSLSELRHLMYP